VKEAITSVCEDVSPQLLDWMLYFVYTRSDSVDKLEYRALVRLLDEPEPKKERVQSAKPQV